MGSRVVIRTSTHPYLSGLIRATGGLFTLLLSLGVAAVLVFWSSALDGRASEVQPSWIFTRLLRGEWVVAFGGLERYRRRFDYLSSTLPVSMGVVTSSGERAVALTALFALGCTGAWAAAYLFGASPWWLPASQVASVWTGGWTDTQLRRFSPSAPVRGPRALTVREARWHFRRAR